MSPIPTGIHRETSRPARAAGGCAARPIERLQNHLVQQPASICTDAFEQQLHALEQLLVLQQFLVFQQLVLTKQTLFGQPVIEQGLE